MNNITTLTSEELDKLIKVLENDDISLEDLKREQLLREYEEAFKEVFGSTL